MTDDQPTTGQAAEHDLTPDDQFRALMEGIRTTLPGVQVLFAFLLTLPLQQSFASLRAVEQAAFYIAFFGSALSSILLIAPSAHQRVRAFRTGIPRKSMTDVHAGAKLALAGTVTFLIALGSSVYLVSTLVFEDILASVALVLVSTAAAWAWFYLPLVTFDQRS